MKAKAAKIAKRDGIDPDLALEQVKEKDAIKQERHKRHMSEQDLKEIADDEKEEEEQKEKLEEEQTDILKHREQLKMAQEKKKEQE